MQSLKLPVAILFGLFVLLCHSEAEAKGIWFWEDDSCQVLESYDEAQKENKEPPHLLRGNKPSYFAAAQDQGDASTHIEFFLSLKYPFYCNEGWSVDFNYNGKYDFYLNSRYSSPIISRLQNPGITFGYKFDEPIFKYLTAIKTGYFHESNGQTISTLAEYNAFRATNPHVQDYVSRGWDYVPLEFKFDFANNLTMQLNNRIFLPKQMFKLEREDAIFWEPNRSIQPKIEQYDGIRLVLSKQFNVGNRLLNSAKLTVNLRSGYRAFHLSQRYETTLRLKVVDNFYIPLYAFYSNGYGREITTYHRKDSYFGVGLEFW